MDVACAVDEVVLREDRTKEEREWADRTWRKGRTGYRKRTSLCAITLRDMVMMMDVHARRANILRGTVFSAGKIVCCDTELGVLVMTVESTGSSLDGDEEDEVDAPLRSAWHKPTRVKGSAVVNRSGRPSVR
jgi:hypothetical protein